MLLAHPVDEEPTSTLPKGCCGGLGCLGVLLLAVLAFPASIYLRHTVISTNTLSVTVVDETGGPVANANLTFSRLTNLMLLPVPFADATPLRGDSTVTTDFAGRAIFRSGCDASQLERIELRGVPLTIQSARRTRPASGHDDGTVWWSPWADSNSPDWRVTVRK